MALFGNLYNPSLGAKMRVPGLDETYAPMQAPSLDSLSGVTGTGSAALTAPMQAPKKPGAFSKDGIGWKILGIIGDSLATAGGGQGTYMPAMLDLQQQTAKERQFQEQLAAQARAFSSLGFSPAEVQAATADPSGKVLQSILDARKPQHFQNKAGDYIQIGHDGQSQTLYTDTTPDIVPVQGSGVYAMDRHTGRQYQGQTGGIPHISNPADLASLPDGAQFIAPDGSLRTKQGGRPAGTSPFVNDGRLDSITAYSESGGNPGAVSPKGARGLMQVMPSTAANPGFGIRPSDGSAQDDVRVGKEYRRAMQARYGGNLPKMWGAYNWGPGRVDRAISRFGDNWLSAAPLETQNYVARNMRAVRGN